MCKRLLAALLREEGATLVEYGLLVLFVALAVTTVVMGIGQGLEGIFQKAVAGF